MWKEINILRNNKWVKWKGINSPFLYSTIRQRRHDHKMLVNYYYFLRFQNKAVFFSCSPSGCTVLRGHPLSLETILPLLFFTITKRLIIYVKRNLTASVITISYIIIYNQFICMKIELQLSHQCFLKIKFFLLKNNFFYVFLIVLMCWSQK